MSADSVRKTFESVAKASTAMGLSAEETEGIFLALGQMISKGTVQAEELRGQLGERLPGAFNLAAQSMGVTTFQLNKMLEQGQVVTADFLPKFVAELDKTYSAGAKLGSDGLNANLNRLNSAFTNMYNTVGGLLTPTFNELLKIGASFVNTISGWINGTNTLKGVLDSSTKSILAEKQGLNDLVLTIRTTNKDNEIRKVLIEQLNSTYPEFTKKIDIAKASDEQLKKALEETNKEYDRRAYIIGTQAIRQDASNKILESQARQAQLEIELRQEIVKGAIVEIETENANGTTTKRRVDRTLRTRNFIEQEIQFRKKTNKELEELLKSMDLIAKREGIDISTPSVSSGSKVAIAEATGAQRKSLEEQAKDRAEFEKRELEAQQQLQQLLLQNRIAYYQAILESDKNNNAEKIEATKVLEATELELVRLKNEQAKTQYEIDKENRVNIKKLTATELQNIEVEGAKQEFDIREKYQKEVEKLALKLLPMKDITPTIDVAGKLEAGVKRAEEVVDGMYERMEKKEKDYQERRQAIVQASEQVLGDIFDFGFDMKAQRLDNELARAQAQRDYELQLAGDSEGKKVVIQQNFAEKEKQIKQRQAQAEKSRAIFEILLQSGINTVRALGTPPAPNFFLAGVTAGVGAVQLALASARPLPKYKDGVDFVPLGSNPQGVDTVPAMLTAGEGVLPVEINRQIRAMGVTNKQLPYIVALGKSALESKKSYEITPEMLTKALSDTFKRMPTNKVVFDKNGFSQYTHTQNSVVKNLNADYSY
jgi:tape measure domain-containing protein